MSNDDSSADDIQLIKISIRKLRKKLRQIENLEKTARPLTAEEFVKIEAKDANRQSLRNFLYLAEQFNVSNLSDVSSDHIQALEAGPGGASSPVTLPESPDNTSVISSIPEEDGSVFNLSLATTPEKETDVSSSTPLRATPTATAVLSTAEKENENENKSGNSAMLKSTDDQTAVQIHDTANRKRKRRGPRKEEKLWLQELKERWASCKWVPYDKHNDNVTSLDCNSNFLVSGSKDTTAVVWERGLGNVVHTLGGHSSTVTAVFLFEPGKVITTSYDSSLRIWDVRSGVLLYSHYLFSPLTCGALHNDKLLLGTEGGKLMYYCLTTRTVLWESIAHEGSIVSVALSETSCASACNSPQLWLWQVTEAGTLSPYPAPDLYNSGVLRVVRSMLLYRNILYYGDDGVNIKVYDLESCTATKIRNHQNDYGCTDALAISNNMLISSSYDLDTGVSSVNIRTLPDYHYLLTLQCPGAGPITCLTCTEDIGVVYCGGHDLALITPPPTSHSHYQDIKISSVHKYHETVVDSMEDSQESDNSEPDEDCEVCYQKRKSARTDAVEQYNGSWCVIS